MKGELLDSRTPAELTETSDLVEMKEKPGYYIWMNHTHRLDLKDNINSMQFFEFSGNYTANVSSGIEDLYSFKSNPNTTFLMQTLEYRIGSYSFKNGSITAKPQREIEKQ
mmetsp:Transcript_31826/g.48819  ORF Transcript_31826/g.48819 Transcript_31826/m.48819 type:complete len:110 (+) Transcript_31826:853-1182(+)